MRDSARVTGWWCDEVLRAAPVPQYYLSQKLPVVPRRRRSLQHSSFNGSFGACISLSEPTHASGSHAPGQLLALAVSIGHPWKVERGAKWIVSPSRSAGPFRADLTPRRNTVQSLRALT